jgi:hypothetical protein
VRGRVAAYAGYQLRDFLLGRAVAIGLVTALATWVYGVTHGLTPAMYVSGEVDARDQLQHAFEFALAVFAIVGGALAVQGLVARDRSRGFDRMILSRPLNPARYYVQGFVLAGIGTVLLATVGAGVYAVAVRPISTLGVAAFVALAWIAIGGLGFLLSTLTGAHAVALAALLAADLSLDRYAVGLRTAGGSTMPIDVLQHALPPAHVIIALAEPFARGAVNDPRAVTWPLVFGLSCLVVAIYLLRRRPARP